jgi:NADPH:quinone reductase-like Zn-dependent oxidoreductase
MRTGFLYRRYAWELTQLLGDRRLIPHSMQAIRFHAYGGPEVLQLEEIPVPEIKPDEVLVRVHAAGVNYIDVYQRVGLYKTPVPFGPGIEGAGIVEKAGADQAIL